jgi:chromosome segregation ATPase
LAGHLRRRQREVDHREARLNAQIAQAEADARSARLLLAHTQSELAAKESDLHERLARLAAGESALDQSQEQSDALAARRSRIEAAEADLADAQAESERLRQALVNDRTRMEEQLRSQRERMEAEHRLRMAEVEERRRALARRSEHVDQCRRALEPLRRELGQMHRETLELRLATEELWAQLSGAAPPAALTRSLGQVRAKLAEEYRRSGADLARQRKELEEIRGQLTGQHESVVRQRRDLDAWAASQREEIERQAQRLVAREQQLEREHAQVEEQARQWKSRELGYQQEIRQLRARLEEAGTVLAAA